MAEFILNTEGTGAPWHSLDAFTQGFVKAAFFCESSRFDSSEFFTAEAQEAVAEGQADGNVPSDAGPADMDSDSYAAVKNLCDTFKRENAALLELAYACDDYDETQAGRDLYFTRAGHGVGYWDREQLKASGGPEESDRLKAIMRAEGTTPSEWSALLDQVEAHESDIGERLSTAAGRSEINLMAYESDKSASGFFVEFSF